MKKTLPYPLPEARARLRHALSKRYIDIPDSKNRAFGTMESGAPCTAFTLRIREERLFGMKTPRLYYRGTLTEAGEETLLEAHTAWPLRFWVLVLFTCAYLVFTMGVLPLAALALCVIWFPTLIHISEDRTDLDRVLQMVFEDPEE